MELRHLRYFLAVGEEEHYGRAAARLRVAQPALSRQIQDLEEEIGFKLFDRMPRGVRISAAGKLFLEDARRILQQLNEATDRARRVARGQSGTLRVGFAENASWHGVVPDSFRRFRERIPDGELQLNPMASLEQIEALMAGHIDAGFIYNMTKTIGSWTRFRLTARNRTGRRSHPRRQRSAYDWSMMPFRFRGAKALQSTTG